MTTLEIRALEIISHCLPEISKQLKRIADKYDKEICCCICGCKIEGYGNNAYPYGTQGNDRCCDRCNVSKVIPERIRISEKQ